MENTTLTTDSTQPNTLVGIGYSTDDVATLHAMLKRLPRHCGCAYAIAPSWSQEKNDDFLDGLQEACPHPVVQLTEETRLQPDHLYVSSPDTFLDCGPDSLRPVPKPSGPEKHTPIDYFFRCLATHWQDQSVGIILSGSGTDGALGIRNIREKGGLTIAQLPEEALIDEMPVGALKSGLVDVVLPLDKVVKFFHGYINQHPRLTEISEGGGKDQSDPDLKTIQALIKGRLGYNINFYKREVLVKSVKRRMRFHLTEEVSKYLEILHRVPEEIQSLADEVMMGFGDFFRPAQQYQKLIEEVIPAIFSKKKAGDSIRIWVICCATGEHAYGLAMLLNDYAKSREEQYTIQVFATDMHDHSLKVARSGRFPLNISQDVSSDQLSLYLDRKSDGFSVKRFLREEVVFSRHELFSDPPFSHLDLIYCNDLFSRLKPESRAKALSIFNFALLPGGFLLPDFVDDRLENEFFSPLDDNAPYILKNQKTQRQTQDISFLNPGSSIRQEKRVMAPDLNPGKYHAEILRQQVSSLLLSDDLKVMHISGKAGDLLSYTAGTPDRKLMNLIHPELKPGLRLLINQLQAKASSAEITSMPVPIKLKGEAKLVTIKASQVTCEKEKFYLLLFEVSPKTQQHKNPGTLPSEGGPAGSDEEKTYLRSLISDYEANEDKLRTSNEELSTTNEELNVALDELAVKSEEYRSAAEELRTMHQENQLYMSELREVNNDLNNLMLSTDLAVLFLDKHMKVKRFTPKVQELFNLRDQDLGRKISDQTHHLHYTELEEDARRVFKTLMPRQREVTDTRGREYLAKVLPYRSSENIIDGVVFSFTDIGDTKEKERMKLQVETAQQLSALKDEFISTVSHEIRTPLNAIINLGKLLLQKNPRKNQLKMLKTLHFSAQGLIRLVNDLLDFSKLEAGKMELEQIDYRPSELMESLYQAHQPAADDKGIHLAFEQDPDLPPVLVGDSYKLTQVLNNLLSNAIKFTEEGEVKLSIMLKHQPDATAILEVSVSDTGIGIPEEKRKQIFEKFTQADNSTVRRFGGTGLGLTISKSLLELMGSDIKIKSKEGEGTTFYFQLQQGVGVDTGDSAAPAARPDDDEVYEIMHHAKILLAEDSSINQMIVQNHLDDFWKVKADFAFNGKEAVEKASETTYDLILMDFRMPEMDGKEATRRIRKLNPHYAKVPILALTADVQAAQDEETEQLFDALVGKPFDPDMLQNTIISLMLPDREVEVNNNPEPPADKPTDASGHTLTQADFAHAEDPFGGDQEQVRGFYLLAINAMRSFRDQLRQDFSDGNVKALSDAIHKQKLLLSMFRLEPLYEMIREQRDQVRDGKKPEDVQPPLSETDQKLEGVIRMLESRLEEVVE